MLLVSSFVAIPASAQPSDEAQHQAASLFDRGVREFAEQRFDAAASSFLAADDLRGSKEARVNALAAAQRGASDVLRARAAQRLLASDDLDERTRSSTQAVLDRVLPKLARIELRCAPEPCSTRLDGEPARAGLLYVLAGPHELRAENEAGLEAVAHVDCDAGAVCPAALHLEVASPAAEPAAKQAEPVAKPIPDRAAHQHVTTPPARPAKRARDPVPLAVFIGATSGAAVFAALTTWSGLEAVHERRRFERDPDAYDDDEVRKHARRADAFLAGTLLCAGGALLTGLLWVDFGAPKRALTLAPWPRGGLTAEGRF